MKTQILESNKMKELNVFCIDVLMNNLTGQPVEVIFPKDFAELKLVRPVFVTWLDTSSKDYRRRLRGCIGTFRAGDLEQNLRNFTLISALEDNRFKPVNNVEELPNFEMSCSLIKEFEEAKDPLDWELGKHGVYVMFHVNGQQYSATYLPEVPIINEWDKKLTLDRCVKKSGYAKELGHLDEVYDSIKLLRYQSDKSKLTFKEYLEKKLQSNI